MRNLPGSREFTGLTLSPDKLNHRGNVRFKLADELGDFINAAFQDIQAGPQHAGINRCLANPALLRRVAFQDGSKPPRLPAKSSRQRLKRPRAATAFHGVPLDFPHDSQRHVRTLRELALTPAKLPHAVIDRTGDRSPIS